MVCLPKNSLFLTHPVLYVVFCWFLHSNIYSPYMTVRQIMQIYEEKKRMNVLNYDYEIIALGEFRACFWCAF